MPEQFIVTKNATETIKAESFVSSKPHLYTDPQAQDLFRVSGEDIIEVKSTSPVIKDMFTKENKVTTHKKAKTK